MSGKTGIPLIESNKPGKKDIAAVRKLQVGDVVPGLNENKEEVGFRVERK